MIRPIALVDLDDCLFQTARKCPPGPLRTMAHDADGRPLSFAGPVQAALIDWLTLHARLIPVTARSLAALRRTVLPRGPGVAAHGGILLGEDGQPCEAWRARMRTVVLPGAMEALAAAAGKAAARLELSVRTRIIADEETPLYLVVKPADPGDPGHGLPRLAQALKANVDGGWTVHLNDANLAFLPPYLGKAQAVAELLPRLRGAAPHAPVLALGDSFTDAPFMALGDFAMTPVGSQLAGRLLRAEAA